MIFLSSSESELWRQMKGAIEAKEISPANVPAFSRSALEPMFHFHAGAVMANRGDVPSAREWFSAGAQMEDENLMSNSFASAFIGRQGGTFRTPAAIFADPRPYLHFTTTPQVMNARGEFVRHCRASLPRFKRPFRIMDLGCGDGGMLVKLLSGLREWENIGDIGLVTLVDSSKAMLDLAEKTVLSSFPDIRVRTVNSRIQDVTGHVDGKYDLVLSALAFHHMTREVKLPNLERFAGMTDHFIIFEISANHDLPELGAPELSCSVYQCYGRIIDFIFSHDAPVEVAQDSVDAFLMAELVSLVTERRGIRNDYHMLKRQWHDLFEESFRKRQLRCLCDSECYSDGHVSLFTMHYGA